MERLIEITNKVIALIDAERVTPLERAAILDLLGTFTQFEAGRSQLEGMQSPTPASQRAPQDVQEVAAHV